MSTRKNLALVFNLSGHTASVSVLEIRRFKLAASMLDRKDIKAIAKARLKDAQVLLRGNRFDGAIYLCGYAIELALKARICQTLKWGGYQRGPR